MGVVLHVYLPLPLSPYKPHGDALHKSRGFFLANGWKYRRIPRITNICCHRTRDGEGEMCFLEGGGGGFAF